MQRPDQPSQPSEDDQKQASQPLFEFPAKTPQVAATDTGQQQVSPEAGDENPYKDEAIRKGLIYPPPPSFYAKQRATQQEARVEHDKQNVQPVAGQFPYPPMPPTTPMPMYRGHPAAGMVNIQPPPFAPTTPPLKRSRKWIWIVIAVCSSILFVCCGLCAWAGYNLIAPAENMGYTSINLVNTYYDAIQAQNYARAYTYIDAKQMDGLTEAQFTQQASSVNKQYGPVMTYQAGTPAFISDPSSPTAINLNRLTITVSVSRQKKTYTVLLTIGRVNGNWKIVDFDRI